MHFVDWLVIVIPLLIILIIGVITHRHMKSVAHFVSGGRVGGRYLLAVAKGELQAGAVVFVALWEIFGQSGFIPTWWGWITAPVGIVMAIFGFVIYRFRETRAMTLAQFFEMRYSRNFRSFTGVLGFLAGIINFGIMPAVGARFMVYFLQLPPEITIPLGAGVYSISTYIPLMAVFIGISLVLTISGGLITLMVTDCVEGIFAQLMYLVIIVGVLCVVNWSEIATVLGSQPPDHSMVNPFDAWAVQDFNLWFVLMGVFLGTYGTMAWQNSGAYNTAGATPHEARMAGLLGRWREQGKVVVIALLAISAMTYLQHADFTQASAAARESIEGIEQAQIRKQMTIPIALSHLLPIGVKGALCAVLLLGIFGGDSTHLHSWGNILAQDIILPRMKKAPTPERHIKLLRGCSIGVGIFAFLFGVFFRQTEYIIMWWQVTTAVYVGGAGAAIIGGLYWKKGTTAGAWAAVISGSILSGGGILAYKIWGNTFLSQAMQSVGLPVSDFTLNGIQISFFSTLISIGLYTGISLLTCRQEYPLAKMLHRDSGADAGINDGRKMAIRHPHPKWTFARLLGFNEHFTTGDKWITGSLFVWGLLWFGVMLGGTAWNLVGQWGWVPWIRPWSNDAWLGFWHVTAIGLPCVITLVTGLWFTWGGIRDIRRLFRSLRGYKIDDSDNGTVEQHKPW
ncbi:sodium:solute symporter family protein [Geminisphaera colitermitum]|uniref:sodium:solute symporter family protein n=1 Tax=Geminisphaera colitermitum TaxID=1148786 RepID=UPI000158C54B|nr:sodium:proline symporter [Geminisphaera colitermitum]